MRQKIIIGIVQALVSGMIVYFFHGTMEMKLLFLSDVLSKNANEWLLKHSFGIIVVLFAINVILNIIILFDADHDKKKKIQDNICKEVFDKHIMTNTNLSHEQIKVSILVKRKGIVRVSKYRWWIASHFKVCGRYQSKQPVKYSKVKFLLDQGVVGLAYSQNTIIAIPMPVRYNKKTRRTYLSFCQDTLKMPEWKTEKLNDKSYFYVCIPIRKYKSNEVIAVMSIDSSHNKLTQLNTRPVEEHISYFEPFFDHDRII